MNDLKQYFRSIGREVTDSQLRHWVRIRDIDHDGVVSLSEYVASFVNQLDPENDDKIEPPAVSALTTAVGALRIGSSIAECVEAIRAIEEYIQRILDSPSNSLYWRIAKHDKVYSSKVGRLFGGDKILIGKLQPFSFSKPPKFTSICSFRVFVRRKWYYTGFERS